ncbi:MAG: response regulator [Gemmatimonadales bacterium]
MTRTILICDDAEFMRMMISQIVKEDGYEVIGEAQTGKEAVESYKELHPDAVTMDIVMPELTGIEAVRAISEFDADARILMVSAVGQEKLVGESLKAGAGDFVIKPFQPDALLQALNGLFA